MKTKKVCVFVIISWIVCVTGNEFFSTEHMAKLLKKERIFQNILKEYFESENVLVNVLQGHIEEVDLYSKANPEEILRDPVADYKLMWRQRFAWEFIVNKFKVNELNSAILNPEVLDVPQLVELDAFALLLTQLLEFYKLDPRGIIDGTLTGTPVQIFLNPDQIYHFSKVAYIYGKYQYAVLWGFHSLCALNRNSSAVVTKEEVLDTLASASYKFGDVKQAICFLERLLLFAPANENAKTNLKELGRKASLSSLPTNSNVFVLNTLTNDTFQALCKGEVFNKTSKRQRALSCRYSTGGGNPRLMYAPVKEEMLWDEPLIIRYHDVISDREIEILKNLTGPQPVETNVGQIHSTVTFYNASQSFQQPDQYSVVARLDQRIADITGLCVKTAIDLHILNFGRGAGYKAHYDTLYENEETNLRGNIIATFLYYMNDVGIGGTTVFPKIGLKVEPKKGSAVFWYNLLQNGQLDLKTEHAECPVFVGNQWVVYKWIREFGQEFRRPCSLSELN